MNDSKFTLFLKRYRYPLLAVSVVCLVTVGVAAFVFSQSTPSTTDNNTQSSQTTQQVNYADELSEPDFQQLSSLLSDDASLAVINTESNATIDKSSAITSLVIFLSSNSDGFEPGSVSAINTEGIELPAGVNLSEYQILVYADGSAWIAYKVNSEGKISNLIMFLGGEDVIVETSSSTTSSEPTTSYSIYRNLTMRFMESVTSPISRKVEDGDTTLIIPLVMTDGMYNQTCDYIAYKDLGAGNREIKEQKQIQITNTTMAQSIYLGGGNFNFEATCTVDGKTYTASARAEIALSPKSACDTKDFGFTKDASKTFEQVKSGVVGTWRGCAFNPWTKPYEMEFVFYGNGNYESRNIEVVKHPDTLRTQVALYYGSDENSAKKQFELKNQLTNADVEGDIQIYFGPYSTNLDEIRSVRLNADGTKLFFEVMHHGEYGPLQYELEKVTE